ncbi:MAG: hypothetical protein KOO66_03020 [Bacteroidales bacterium]|nr:hypothetical protein [Bacteroidales bacterium]
MLIRETKAILLNKIDLIEYTNFNKASCHVDLNNVNGKVPFMEISCIRNIGMDKWYNWISKQISSK